MTRRKSVHQRSFSDARCKNSQHASLPVVNTNLCVLRQVEDGVQPLCVVMSGLLLIRQVSVGLRQSEEPPDGAQVLPQGAVLRAGILLPPKQLAQPALQVKQRTSHCHWAKKMGAEGHKRRTIGI